mgnify:CR=1 FL=1
MISINNTEFYKWLDEVSRIANSWNQYEYPLDRQWATTYWYNTYYLKKFTPEQTWNDYTTMIK